MLASANPGENLARPDAEQIGNSSHVTLTL
jgi:hypothetical protein